MRATLPGAHFIDGSWDARGEQWTRANPAHPAEKIGSFPSAGPEQVGAAVAAARRAAPAWRAAGAIKRGAIVERLGALLERHADDIATAISAEHGKSLVEAKSEVARAVELARYAAGMGRRYGGKTLPSDTPKTLSATDRRPVGVVALITPWNFPLAIPVWKLAPALVSGCTIVLKPSPLTPMTAQLLIELASEAGVPAGVVNLVHGGGETGRLLVEHPDVVGVSFTGSVETGRRIQEVAARGMKRTQLEMGGKNAVIVMPDADLVRAADAIVAGAFGQAGQRCSATSRAIVHQDVYEKVIGLVVDRVRALRVGFPDDPSTDLGPLVDERSLQRCLAAIADARAEGGKIESGGAAAPMSGGGHFMQPTVISGVSPDSSIATTEIFGPVLIMLSCIGFEDAITINNSVQYGMSATLFTGDLRLIGRFLDEAEAGMLHVNRPGVGAFPHMPHVGTKASQLGPAECSEDALDFFTEVRTVTVDVS